MNLNLKAKEAKEYSKKDVLLIIREYVKNQEDLSRREMLDKTNFSLAAWSEHQAYQLGIQKMCSKLESFIPNPDQEGN